MGVELFHADKDRQMNGQTHRRTDMMKLIVAFHNFANMPKKSILSHNYTLCNKTLQKAATQAGNTLHLKCIRLHHKGDAQ
jgi:3-dehydroquinate dehydratase